METIIADHRCIVGGCPLRCVVRGVEGDRLTAYHGETAVGMMAWPHDRSRITHELAIFRDGYTLAVAAIHEEITRLTGQRDALAGAMCGWRGPFAEADPPQPRRRSRGAGAGGGGGG